MKVPDTSHRRPAGRRPESRNGTSRLVRVVTVLLLILASLLVAQRWLYDTLWWAESSHISPLALGTALPVRNDPLGEGAFGAKRRKRVHRGLDIASPIGTPVRATRAGIATTGFDPRGYGHHIEIRHEDGSMTLYGHMESCTLYAEEPVKQGEVIGAVGRSGNADFDGMTTHLHFELHVPCGDELCVVDPLTVLNPFSPYDGPYASRLAQLQRGTSKH